MDGTTFPRGLWRSTTSVITINTTIPRSRHNMSIESRYIETSTQICHHHKYSSVSQCRPLQIELVVGLRQSYCPVPRKWPRPKKKQRRGRARVLQVRWRPERIGYGLSQVTSGYVLDTGRGWEGGTGRGNGA